MVKAQLQEDKRQLTANLNSAQQSLQVILLSCSPNIIYIHTFFYYAYQSLRADLEEREAQLKAQEEEMKERNAEITRLLGELRRCQTQLLEQQVCNNVYSPLSLLQF